MLRDIEMHQPAPAVAQHQEHEQDSKGRRGGSEIASFITEQAFDDLDAPVGRITGANAPTPYTKNLERLNSPTPEKIAAAVRRGYINSLMRACAMSDATPSGRCASGPPSPRTGSS
jgi:transketolase-like protein